ncbi:MAG: putative Ni/Fe-hydrogenase 2 b-type cytochrome subunit [Verrucomicrobiae bacterium]|nr:putative Ni/Fe-hydrogenase 2 b-type cytochrome subunit [Verrucomicrobiae bacterium]
MHDFTWLLILFRIVGVLVGVSAAIFVCWLLAGRKFPQHLTSAVFGWLLLIVLWGVGGYALTTRYALGLGAVTNLSDQFPWGIWKALVLCGISFAAGGFLTACMVYIFRIRTFYPILRPVVLAAYLGYMLSASGSLLVDLGRYHQIWRPIFFWQHHSVLFEVSWCVMLYTGVLTVEFAPILLDKLGWHKLAHVVHSITVPFVICGVVLSTLHQSSLGSLFLIVPNKLLPLWYTPQLPILFFISALASGFAMAIFVSALAFWTFRRPLEPRVLTALAKGMTPVLLVYLFLRVVDLTARNAWRYIFENPLQGASFTVEMVLLTAPLFVVLRTRWSGRRRWAFAAAIPVIVGVILNRLNVAWIGLLPATGADYVPSWIETVVTLNLVSVGVVIFGLAARYLPLFEHATPGEHAEVPAHVPA